MLQMKSKGSLPEKANLFVLFRPSTNYMTSTHRRKGNWLYSKATDLNVNPIENTFIETHRIIFDQISGQPMAQLT